MKKRALALMISSALAFASPVAMADISEGYRLLEKSPTEAYSYFISEYEQAASAADAAFILGMMHYNGVGTKIDQNKAIQWLEKAATLQHPQAIFNLGILRYKQEIPARGDIEGKVSFRSAMALGDDRAAMMSAVQLLELRPKNVDSAMLNSITTHLEEALESGYSFAGLLLGIYHSEVPWLAEEERDFAKAIAYLERSFSEGVIPAAYGLVALYESGGNGLKANPEMAQHYQTIIHDLQRNNQLGDPEDYLPKPYSLWSIMSQDALEAHISRLEQAASNGNSEALLALIEQVSQLPNTLENRQRATEYRDLLATMDSPDILYKRGIKNVKKVNDEGWKLIESAAQQNYLPALKWLADSRHWGWTPDKDQISQYQKAAADLGDAEMIYYLLNTLIDDYEEMPNEALSTQILKYANELQAQDPESVQSLIVWSMIYRDGIGVEKDPQQAFSLRKKAVEIAPQDVVHQMTLARMYYHGYGTNVDKAAAARHYLIAQKDLRQQHALENITPTRYKNVTESLIRLHQELAGFADYPELQKEILKTQFEATPETARSAKILDSLLDDLAMSLERGAGGNREYGYLLTDRDFAQYRAAKAANKPLNELSSLKRKVSRYNMHTSNNDRAKLHALRAYGIEIRDNQAQLAALKSGEEAGQSVDVALQSWLVKEIENDLVSAFYFIKGLELLISEETKRPHNYEKNRTAPHLAITEEEQAEALEIIMQLITASPEIQQWVGDKLLPGNAALKSAFETLANDGHAFAQDYLKK